MRAKWIESQAWRFFLHCLYQASFATSHTACGFTHPPAHTSVAINLTLFTRVLAFPLLLPPRLFCGGVASQGAEPGGCYSSNAQLGSDQASQHFSIHRLFLGSFMPRNLSLKENHSAVAKRWLYFSIHKFTLPPNSMRDFKAMQYRAVCLKISLQLRIFKLWG